MGEAALRATPPPVPAPYALRVLEGPDKELFYPLAQKSVVIGRGNECDLQLHDMKCSRSHIKLEILGRTMKVTNLSVSSPMQINGREVTEALLAVGAVIGIGTSFLRFEANSADAPPPPPRPTSLQLIEMSKPAAMMPNSPGGMSNGMSNGMSSPAAAAPSPFERQGMGHADMPFTNVATPQKRNPIFYGVVALVVIGTLYLMTVQSRNAKKLSPIRTDEIVDKELQSLQEERDKLVQKRIREGKDTEAFDQAQSAFIKGFRDYREGNYKRAITNLDAARALYPDHPQATRYRLLASQRLDQLVQDTMREARGQVERNQYKLAVSNYRKVIVLIDDANNPTFKEARLQVERLQEVLKGDL